MSPEVTVEHDADRHRWVIREGEEPIGLAAYRPEPGTAVITHTEIDPDHGGRGLGTRLVAEALADARARGLSVVPACPFVRDYIADHPEQLDLVPTERRAALGL